MATARRGVSETLQSLATTGNGTAFTANPVAQNHTVVVTGVGTISGGTVSIEEADTESYTGTWSVLATITASALTGGAQQITHIAGLLQAVRARVSSNITGGGTISASLKSY